MSEKVRRTLEGEEARLDASADAFAVVLGFLQTGRGFGDLVEHTFTHHAPGLRHYRRYAHERGREAAHLKIRHEIRRAREHIHRNPAAADPAYTQYVLAQIADAADGHPEWFAGKAGNTDFIVLQNLIATAIKAKSLRLTASGRQIALAAGYTAPTAARSLKRLSLDGTFVRRTHKSGGATPAEYQLRLPADVDRHRDGEDDGEDDGDFPRHSLATLRDLPDLFAARNLGPTAGRLYALVRDDVPITARGLDRRLARHRSTVNRHLKTLVDAGMITRTADGYLRTRAMPTPAVAVREPRRALYDGQRRSFHQWLDMREARRGAPTEGPSGSSPATPARGKGRNISGG